MTPGTYMVPTVPQPTGHTRERHPSEQLVGRRCKEGRSAHTRRIRAPKGAPNHSSKLCPLSHLVSFHCPDSEFNIRFRIRNTDHRSINWSTQKFGIAHEGRKGKHTSASSQLPKIESLDTKSFEK